MTRRAYLYFVVTFLIGIAVGAAGLYYYAWRARLWHHPWNENRAIHRMTRRLDLAPPQVQELRAILDNTVKQWNQIQDQMKPQLDALHKQTDDRIRQILNTEQRNKFEVLVREHERREKRGKKR